MRNAGYNSSCSINQLRGQYEPGSYTVCMKGFVFACLFVCVWRGTKSNLFKGLSIKYLHENDAYTACTFAVYIARDVY